MTVTDSVGVTPGAGANVATYSITEDAKTKEIQRVAVVDPLGNDLSIGGQTVAVAVTPLVTVGAPYGAGFCIGDIMELDGMFGDAGSGLIRLARVTCNAQQSMGLTLFLFDTNPISSAGTISDNALPVLNAADATKMLMAISLDPANQLVCTVWSAVVDAQVSIGSPTLFAVLVTDAGVTTQFTSASDLMVELTVTQDN